MSDPRTNPRHQPSAFSDLLQADAGRRFRRRQATILAMIVGLATVVLLVAVAITWLSNQTSTTRESGNNQSLAERDTTDNSADVRSHRAKGTAGQGKDRDKDNVDVKKSEPKSKPAGPTEEIFRPALGPEATATVPDPVDAPRGDNDADASKPAEARAEIRPDAVPNQPEQKHPADQPKEVPAVVKKQEEVLYQGKPASYWVKALREGVKNPDWYAPFKAAEAIEAIGPAAKAVVPDLTKLLTYHEVTGPLESDFHSRAVRENAARALGGIGPDAKAAIPSLVKALKDKENSVRRASAKALGRICRFQTPQQPRREPAGPDAKVVTNVVVPGLIELLKDEDGHVQREGADALGEIGPEAKDAIPALFDALSAHAGAEFAKAMAKIGPEAVPALSKALRDRDRRVRDEAARALGEIGPEAKTAVPALVEAIKETPEYPDSAAAKALKKIDPDAAAKAKVR